LGEDFWFWVLTLGVAVVGGGTLSLRWLKVARVIEDTPTSRLRSAAQGYVELTGRGLPLEGARNVAPLTQRPCVWWRYSVQKRTGGGGKNRDSWQTVSSGRSVQPFLLDDGTGRCIVKPDGAEVMAGESSTWYGDTPLPTGQPPGGWLSFGRRDYRYFEERIYENERVLALGDFTSVRGGTAEDIATATADLLARWKEDQASLVQRFDRDGDGRIGLAEWEQARAEARRTIERAAQERPEVPSLNVLSRPGGDQLFLIAALPEGDLASRYRRKAFVAFLGFVAGVYAFGWLLQRAFG
jgi:hypothetical protein